MFQNIPYGRNDCTLDIYHPNIPRLEGGDMSLPVVVFVYGGAWGSGHKSMYGQLCVEIANHLKAVVCCPNHAVYPKVKILRTRPRCSSYLPEEVYLNYMYIGIETSILYRLIRLSLTR